MRIESLNVGGIEMLSIRGKEIPTGIYKYAVSEKVLAHVDGLGDDVLVERRKAGRPHHAVSLYPREHYAFWADRLGRAPFRSGFFGENLTTEGYLETDARIGDVVRCGEAVLQVAQPRIPCRKLSARVAARFAGAFLRSRRTGFYFRVLEPGMVAAGDAIELLESDPDSPTVDEFIRIAEFDFWDVHGLEYLLGARDLVPFWRDKIADKLERAHSADGWFGLRELRVSGRDVESSEIVSLHLSCARGRPLAPFHAGQYLTLAIRPSTSGPSARRAYGISSDPSDLSSYRITVRRQPSAKADTPAGVVSAYLHDALEVGQTVRAAAPRGFFSLEGSETDGDRMAFIAEGIGIAPMVSMMRSVGSAPRRPIAVVHVASGTTHPLRREVEALAAELGATVEHRFVPAAEVPTLRLGELADGEPGHFFIAGSTAFVRSVKASLIAAGVDPKRIREELFGKL